MVAKYFASQTIKGVLNIRNWIGIFAGDGVDAPVIDAEAICAIGLLGKADW